MFGQRRRSDSQDIQAPERSSLEDAVHEVLRSSSQLTLSVDGLEVSGSEGSVSVEASRKRGLSGVLLSAERLQRQFPDCTLMATIYYLDGAPSGNSQTNRVICESLQELEFWIAMESRFKRLSTAWISLTPR